MLENKIAIVTGASRGIGREIAIQLSKEGAYVVINYSGNEAAAKDVLSIIEAAGGKGEIYQCDVSSTDAVKVFMDDIVNRHKTIDIIVNNAGITKDNLILKMSEDEFDIVLNTNLKGAFNTVKAAVKYMLKQRSGKIINITSVSGITGNPGQVNYSSAKAGLIGMTKTLAKELASRGINVNAVAPGFIKTDMTGKLSDELIKKVEETIPLRKLGDPKDIAEMVTFLASSKADYITGQVIQVDGGIAM
ncbi:3-oxoacyl-[acyl-carrier-protein] reductase [Anaeromicropila herbilytica]|uniref:3-oxoacyl-[acyl-carrier-protein] reductase n=1 Tax=Anaeromicropila herbilytica TaxID=2785025 RepID=A0A7R7EGD6_9FIRM|nr:3-oxoacyl-[acyl-carrier-protein] reductase [Anaeromicropila herbilytica]BCN28720.1 3-oxoacyl-[acyl-carrier-protein] reductase FabG [Anaeromicropila herbilytica]